MSVTTGLLAGLVGFTQGFVGIASTVGLAPKLAREIVSRARESYDPIGTTRTPRLFYLFAIAVSCLALLLIHFVVMDQILGSLSDGDPIGRSGLGRIWVFALLAGLLAAKVAPEIESRTRREDDS